MAIPFYKASTFTGLVSTKNYGTSEEWNRAFTTVKSNSAAWGLDTRSLWGSISGTLSAQTDLWSYLSAVGTSNFDIATLNNYLSTTPVLLSSLNVNGTILSAGVNLFDIFITSAEESQTLSYNTQTELLAISNGNSVSLSSLNDKSYANSNFLKLSGGIVSGNLTVQGNISALGTATFANTIFTTTSALSVVNTGPGPALYIFQSAGPYDVASFYDGDGIEVLHVGNAGPGGFGKVGVNESFPNEELTVRGSISATETIYATSILSGGVDLLDIFGSSADRLINGSYQVILSSNGDLALPGAIVTASNSKLDLVGFGPNTAYLTTTPDDSTALFMGANVAELRANTYVSIATNTSDITHLWEFGADGGLKFPDNTTQTTAFTGNPDPQTLSYTASSAELSISNGNTVTLSALSGQKFNQSLNTTNNVQFNQVNANVYLSGGTNLLNILSSSGGTGSNNYIYTTTSQNVLSNRKYAFDTSNSSLTATLPVSPQIGDEIEFFDITGYWFINNLVIANNGNYIEQKFETLECDVKFGSIQLIYVGPIDNIGWRIIPKPRHSVPSIISPFVSISSDISLGYDPIVINFAGINNLDSSVAPVNNWYWNLTGGNTPDYFTQNVSYNYSIPGVYTVNLTASNAVGIGTASKTITALPMLVPVPAIVTTQSLTGYVSYTITLSGINTLPVSSSPVANWYWNLTGGNTADYTTQVISHTYNSEGTYTVNLTASNASGFGTATQSITASLSAAPADIYSDYVTLLLHFNP